MTIPVDPAAPLESPPVSFREGLRVWLRIALQSFGGPAAQIAVMHRVLVDEKRWVNDAQFLHALNFCMLLPGPEAQQLTVYIGWLLHGVKGGLAAGLLFVAPGCLCIGLLSVLYAAYQQTAVLSAVFFGLKPAVAVVVFEALLKISRRVLKGRAAIAVAVLAFAATHLAAVPFPAIVLVAGLLGAVVGRWRPELLTAPAAHRLPASASAAPAAIAPAASAQAASAAATAARSTALEPADGAKSLPRTRTHSWRRSVRVLVLGLALWWTPTLLFAWRLGWSHVLTQQGVFFSQAAVVTFGGAYAVLAYVQQQAVERFQWLSNGEMADGLALAETTPGPLIMVVQFVAFLGAFRAEGPWSPMAMGLLGSAVTTWATFAPCFLWIFLGAPYVERLRGNRALAASLAMISAAVVGVIAHVALVFTWNSLFAKVGRLGVGFLNVPWPDWSTLDVRAVFIGGVAAWLLLKARRSLFELLAWGAGAGLLLSWRTLFGR